MAVGMCAVVTLSLTIFAFQTKIDFTAWGGKSEIRLVYELKYLYDLDDLYINQSAVSHIKLWINKDDC